jgi:SAM-dependent methyltransferase
MIDHLINLQRTNLRFATNRVDNYLKIMEVEYDRLKPFLPTNITSVLDIGCGLGGMDIFLYRDYQPKITFLDRDGLDDHIKYGYNDSSHKYNLLSETQRFVEMYGVSGATYVNIDQGLFPSDEFDLTISLLAMGYHFPLETYKLNTRYLVADMRFGQVMPANGQVIYEGENYYRTLWQNF